MLQRIDLAEEWKASLLNVKKEHHVMRGRRFYCASERTSKALIWSPTTTLPVHDSPPRPRARRIHVGIGVVERPSPETRRGVAVHPVAVCPSSAVAVCAPIADALESWSGRSS